ncbi:MAG: hydrogenase 4 subunit B [Deltaproteobacteria bacterium]|nr:hydrogenase 4 subunit B [Deltaproteobacteria bacterium]
MTMPSPMALAVYSVVILLIMAISALVFKSRQGFLVNAVFAFSSLACVMALTAGFQAVSNGAVETLILPIGLPDLPFYLRIDALSGFFIAIIGLLGLFVSIYSLGYVRGFVGQRSITSLAVFYPLFMAGMILVVISDDAYFFMIAWELMAVSSFFLVCFEDESGANRRAAFIYLLIAHIGAVMILLSFGLMAGFASGFENFKGYTFSAMRGAHISPGWASAAFLLAFFGFAAKAGVVPLHVWLPEAHPAAPSNVSALMSGVMLKTALYGIIRLTFDILTVSQWWWGGIVLVLGLISAVTGILYAIMQVDLKRALAYSSVENVGIILISIGLSMIFTAHKMHELASLALIAGLYHSLNHAMFKGLLFMGAGAILHATHERNMERMGGLIHKLPWTATLFLIGCLSISAMPPFNGFVSEWLTFQAFLLSPALPNPILKLLFPLGAALLALTAALSARCFVKVYSVTFLGRWRGEHPCAAREVNWPMKAGMCLCAASCLLLGVFPTAVIGWADMAPLILIGAKISVSAKTFGWLWLTPVSSVRASYSAPVIFIGITAVVAAAYAVFHSRRSSKTALTRAPVWGCGFEKLTNRMQYNSTSFAMPLRRIFGFLMMIKESVTPQDANAHGAFQRKFVYRLMINDRVWYLLYKPFSKAAFWCARKAGFMQHGRIQIYLLYSFITLIVLLVFA